MNLRDRLNQDYRIAQRELAEEEQKARRYGKYLLAYRKVQGMVEDEEQRKILGNLESVFREFQDITNRYIAVKRSTFAIDKELKESMERICGKIAKSENIPIEEAYDLIQKDWDRDKRKLTLKKVFGNLKEISRDLILAIKYLPKSKEDSRYYYKAMLRDLKDFRIDIGERKRAERKSVSEAREKDEHQNNLMKQYLAKGFSEEIALEFATEETGEALCLTLDNLLSKSGLTIDNIVEDWEVEE